MKIIDRILDAIAPEPNEVFVTEPPLGFFRIRFAGSKRPDCLAHNDLTFGLCFPVKDPFTVGGKAFTRARDERGRLVPLKILVRQVRSGDAYVRGNKRFADTTRLEEFTGEFEYEPTA